MATAERPGKNLVGRTAVVLIEFAADRDLTVAALAERLGVNVKSISRDISTLQAAGILAVHKERNRNRYKFDLDVVPDERVPEMSIRNLLRGAGVDLRRVPRIRHPASPDAN